MHLSLIAASSCYTDKTRPLIPFAVCSVPCVALPTSDKLVTYYVITAIILYRLDTRQCAISMRNKYWKQLRYINW